MTISIPPFNNVPSPGDPIRSPWAQQITQYAVDTRKRHGAGKTGAVTVASGAFAYFAWTSSAWDTDGYQTDAANLAVPAGRGGMYGISIEGVALAGAIPNGVVGVQLTAKGVVHAVNIQPGAASGVITIITDLAPGDVINGGIYNAINAANSFSGSLVVQRLGDT